MIETGVFAVVILLCLVIYLTLCVLVFEIIQIAAEAALRVLE